MSEALHTKSNSKTSLEKRVTQAAVALVIAVGATGCSKTIDVSAPEGVSTCNGYPGARYYIDARSSDKPVESASELEAAVSGKMAVLYKRIDAAGGSKTFDGGAISIFEKSVGEAYGVATSPNMMTITFPYTENGFNTTKVQVDIIDGQPEPLANGAIVCMHDSELFPNGLVGIVDSMLEKTQGLDALLK